MIRKKKKRLILIQALLVAFISATISSSYTSYATQTEMDDAKTKKNQLEEEKKKTKKLLDNLNSLKSDAAAYVSKLDASLSEVNAQIDTINTNIEAKENEISITNKELASASDAKDEQYESMKLRIKYMYEKGDTSYIDMILGASNAGELLNRTEYISDITNYDRAKLDEYETTCNDIKSKEEKLKTEKSELSDMKTELEAKQSSVQTMLDDKKSQLATYNSKINTASAELSEYEKQIKQQEDTIKAIEAQIRKREEEARKAAQAAGKSYETVDLGSIHFIWPCPSSSRITSGFGDRESPTEGASSNHQGIDIGASSGSAILAAADGEVVVSTYSPSAGNYIMLSHGGSVFTVYMHCSALLVSTGDTVKAGDTIAKVGSTGYSTGPHLHFGIRSNGKYLNPSNYVSP